MHALKDPAILGILKLPLPSLSLILC